MEIAPYPSFELSVAEARALQLELRVRVVTRGRVRVPQRLAGADVAIDRGGTALASAVAWDCASGEVLELRCVRRPLRFPYVPGLLSFREGGALLDALALLETPVDAVLIDGAGSAHPRGLGLASHVGLFLPVPSVGVAKSRLFGRHAEPGAQHGDTSDLEDDAGRRIGTVLRSRVRARPIFVSPGDRISIDGALALVRGALRGHRLPEPTWLADRLGRSAKGVPIDRHGVPCSRLASDGTDR